MPPPPKCIANEATKGIGAQLTLVAVARGVRRGGSRADRDGRTNLHVDPFQWRAKWTFPHPFSPQTMEINIQLAAVCSGK
jgi:hypothetical protein